MPLFDKNGKELDDDWVIVADDAVLPVLRPVVVTLARWRAERETLIVRQSAVGVVLAAGELAGDIASDLKYLALIQVTFPSFADGRAYTTARLLRERFRYEGEIRAGGDVLLDQLQAMRRCGIDTFLVQNEPTIRWTREGHRPSIDLFYQPSVDNACTIQALRNAAFSEPARLAS